MKENEQGFTLIELLISVSIALIISAAIFGIYANSAGTSAAMLKSSKLNQELYSLMLVMSNDIRRAGYIAAPDPTADPEKFQEFFEKPQNNPFAQDDTELALITTTDDYVTSGMKIEADEAGDANCILYAFDEDENNTLESDEIYGFRLRNNTVEMLKTPNKPENDDCSDDKGVWEAVTDSGLLKIEDLVFERSASKCINATDDSDCYDDSTPPSAGDITVETRQIKITLKGQLANDPNVRAKIEHDVRVRNDRVKEHSS